MTVPRFRKDDGQVTLVVVLLAVLVLVCGLGIMIFGEAADHRGRAQKAADAAALAAAAGAREAMVRPWMMVQPPPPIGPINVDPSAYFQQVASASRATASSYASKNDGASLDSYSFSRMRVSVDVHSKRDTTQTPVRPSRFSTLSAPATATAEVRSRGFGCRYANVVTAPSGQPISWDIVCGSGFRSATAKYLEGVLVTLGALSSWERLFDVRLVR